MASFSYGHLKLQPLSIFTVIFAFAAYRVFGMLSTTLHGTLSQTLYPFAQWGSEVLKVVRF